MLIVALKMLLHSRAKFLGMIIGTSFAAFIMMQQYGIYQGIVDRLAAPITLTSEPDLWVMDSSTEDFSHPNHFAPIDIYRIRSIPGVIWVRSLYHGSRDFFHSNTNSWRNWDIILVDPKMPLGLPKKMMAGNRESIHQSDAVLVDGYALQQMKTSTHKTIALGDILTTGKKQWVITGITQPLRTFSTAPKLYLTSNHLTNYESWGSFLLVKAKSPQDITQIAAEIHKKTNYLALTQQEFIQRSLKFYKERTPILLDFIFIAVLGFIIGLITMGQIFSNFILTNIQQFGMLKILGVPNMKLIEMVLFQALVIGGLGYFNGLLSLILFGFVTSNTAVAFHLTTHIALSGAIAVGAIIISASYFSILKILRLDSMEMCRE